MAEREKRGWPDRKLTDQNNRPEEQNGERGDVERDWVDVMFESLAEEETRDKKIYGKYHKKLAQNYVINGVADVLQHLWATNDMSDEEIARREYNRNPTGDRIRAKTKLDAKSKADIDMITWGFTAVAYEHLYPCYQFPLHDHLLNLNYYFRKLKPDAPFDEFKREFTDRFELTYEQAKTLQKITKRANLTYDPGGRELTPENIAKRTFHSKDYLNRPIMHGHRY